MNKIFNRVMYIYLAFHNQSFKSFTSGTFKVTRVPLPSSEVKNKRPSMYFIRSFIKVIPIPPSPVLTFLTLSGLNPFPLSSTTILNILEHGNYKRTTIISAGYQ